MLPRCSKVYGFIFYLALEKTLLRVLLTTIAVSLFPTCLKFFYDSCQQKTFSVLGSVAYVLLQKDPGDVSAERMVNLCNSLKTHMFETGQHFQKGSLYTESFLLPELFIIFFDDGKKI